MPVFLNYVLLLVSALILAGIGVIIAFLGEKACLSRQCVGQAKFINRGMDKDLKPCDDFYSFVCNNFQQFGSSIFDEIERKQLKRLVQYLGVRANWEADGRVEHIAKSLYQNCINDTQLKIEGLIPLQRILEKLGGIPFLDPLWDYEKKSEFNVVDTELKHFFNGLNAIFVHNRIIRTKTYPSIPPKNESENEKKKMMFHAFSIPPHLYNAIPPDPENYLNYCVEFNNLYSKIILTNKTLTDKDKLEIKEAAKFKIKFLKLVHRTRNCSEQPFSFINLPYDKKFGKPTKPNIPNEPNEPNEYPQNNKYLKDDYKDPDYKDSEYGDGKRGDTESDDKGKKGHEDHDKEEHEDKKDNTGNILTTLQMYVKRKAEPGKISYEYYGGITPQFENYIDELNELIKDVPDRVLAIYMGVESLIQMTPFLPSQFRDIQDQYLKSERDKHNSVLNDRKLHCAKLVKDAMTTALTAAYLRENPKPPEGLSVLNSLLFELLMEVKLILKNIKWPSTRDRKKMLHLANSIKIASPLPSDVLEKLQEKTSFDLFYIIMCTNEDSTLESYLSVKVVRMIRNARILNYKELYDTSDPFTIFHEDYDIFDIDIYFQEESNVVVVPMAYLFYPSLDSLWPKYLSFGGLAVWIAHKIIKTVGYNNVQYPEINPGQTSVSQWWEKETVSRYENKRRCALDEYNHYLKHFHVKSNDANCLEDTLYYAAAVQAAYLAYKENTRHRFFVEARIPYLTKYTVDQIFFIKYASSFCRYEGEGNKWYKKDSDSARVSSNFTVLYTLSNFPKFSEIFECGKDDKMTNEKPCNIWEHITNY